MQNILFINMNQYTEVINNKAEEMVNALINDIVLVIDYGEVPFFQMHTRVSTLESFQWKVQYHII